MHFVGSNSGIALFEVSSPFSSSLVESSSSGSLLVCENVSLSSLNCSSRPEAAARFLKAWTLRISQYARVLHYMHVMKLTEPHSWHALDAPDCCRRRHHRVNKMVSLMT